MGTRLRAPAERDVRLRHLGRAAAGAAARSRPAGREAAVLRGAARRGPVRVGAKAVLAHPEFRAEVDAEGLAELFSQFGTATPGHAIYRGLAEVRPGSMVTAGRGGVRTAAYWARKAAPHADGLAATAATYGSCWPTRSPADRRRRAAVQPAVRRSRLQRGLRAGRRQPRGGGTGRSSPPTPWTSPAARTPSNRTSCARATTSRSPAPRRSTSAPGTARSSCPPRPWWPRQWAPLAAHDLPTMGDMWVSIYLLFRG